MIPFEAFLSLSRRAGLVALIGLAVVAALVTLLGLVAGSLPARSSAPQPGSGPLIAFLAPAGGAPANIHLLDPAAPTQAIPVTSSASGVYDFAVSPDGAQIAFSEYSAEGGIDLRLLDRATDEISTLVACAPDDCTAPAWSPDGMRLAYERTPGTAGGANVRPTRVWVLDLSGATPVNAPLFEDEALYTVGPVWSPDGTRLASYDLQNSGILIHDLTGGADAFLPTLHGSTGIFSPDGARLAYLDIVFASETAFYTHIRMADLRTGQITALSAPDAPVDDARLLWTPKGTALVVGRRLMDEGYTPGHQLYLVAASNGDAKPLAVDPAYATGAFAWEPDGVRLVIQRFPAVASPVAGQEARPSLWVLDTTSGQISKLVADAFLPEWAPAFR
ncbi:MAG: hypothetical protein HPY64_14040 [Anaerolineae bacterium]|nr:hypothetical protein [Anaerolineae bacterium]